MLMKLFSEVFRDRGENANPGRPVSTPAVPPEAPSLERIRKLTAAAEHAPVDKHLQLLYGGVTVGGMPLLELTDQAMRRSNTWNPPAKTIHRRERTFNLAQYFLYASRLPGLQAECGVFNGCSALACCLARRAAEPGFDGRGMYLLDSFEGLSDPTAEDWFERQDAVSGAAPPLWPRNGFKTDMDAVRPVFNEFPSISIHKGWIPGVFEGLPQDRWSFVHIDVDLYAPTRACLEYFLPRLVPGGVIVCDDYGSLMFPGAARAWDEVLMQRKVPFVELPTGQAVVING
jgi:O-methyltransferase